MIVTGDHELLLILIEHVGKDLEENYRPEDVRLDPIKIELLVSIRELVATRKVSITLQELQLRCPSFLSAYRAVMLREFKELNPHGTYDEG